MVDFPKLSIKEMLECGVHFGHKRRYHNPKMNRFIYEERNGIHIINLQKTFPLLHQALKVVQRLIQQKPSAQILFVGTKHQASACVKEYAKRCGQFYVDRRWLGGTLTNWNTVSKSIRTLETLENKIAEIEASETDPGYRKKEILNFKRQCSKLEQVLGGIRKLKGRPDLMFVIDVKAEHIAVKEAQRFNIPIVAIVDTNSNPDGIDYVIPGNDDSAKAIRLYCSLLSDTILHTTERIFEESGISLESLNHNTPLNTQKVEKSPAVEESAVSEEQRVQVLTKKTRRPAASAETYVQEAVQLGPLAAQQAQGSLSEDGSERAVKDLHKKTAETKVSKKNTGRLAQKPADAVLKDKGEGQS